MAIYKRSEKKDPVYWFKFQFGNRTIREPKES